MEDELARRVEHIEKKLSSLEVSLVRQLEALTVAYQHMARSLDQVVTRSEFVPLQKGVQLLCIVVSAAVVVLIFKGWR